MRKWVASLAVVAMPSLADGGSPLSFGTYAGMSKEELSESVVLTEESEEDGKSVYTSPQAPDNTYRADKYGYELGETGLCRVVAMFSDVRSTGNTFSLDIARRYGKPARYEGEEFPAHETVHYPSSQYRLADGVQDLLIAQLAPLDRARVMYLFENYPDC